MKYTRTLDMECPQCGARSGEPCVNYKGQKKALHVIRQADAPRPRKRKKVPCDGWQLGDLFDHNTTSGQAGKSRRPRKGS